MLHEAQNPDSASPLPEPRVLERRRQDHRPGEPTLFDPRLYDDLTVAIEWDEMDALQEFHDPVHGFVSYTRREVEIIDHPAFQRLFKVYQLGQTHLVFRGATHSRGQHSLGAVAAVELLMDATDRTYERRQYAQEQMDHRQLRWKWQLDRRLDRTERAFARLASLLHDIGHIVNGHTIEDELGLLHDHGSRQRLDLILRKTDWVESRTLTAKVPSDLEQEELAPENTSVSRRDDADEVIDTEDKGSLRQLINQLYGELALEADVRRNRRISDVQPVNDETDNVDSEQLSASQLLVEIIVRDSDRSELADELSNREEPFRVSVLRDLVGNTVCADLIDYLQRDWRHIGKPRHLDTRLLQYMEIVTDSIESKLVVNLRSNHDRRPRPDVMSAILELLESRYHLWEVALLHRTKTSASGMLERAILERACEAGTIDDLRDRLSRIKDEELQTAQVEHNLFRDTERALLRTILEVSDPESCRALSKGLWSKQTPSTSSHPEEELLNEEDGISHRVFSRLDRRKLYKEIARVEYGVYSQDVSELLSPFKASRVDRFLAAYRRLSSLKKLEADFELQQGDLVIYCLPFGLGKKLAEVQIIYDDQVQQLKELDAQLEISGGHLQAQLNRYDRLWRASLFASSGARDKLHQARLLHTIRTTFRLAVLGLSDVDHTMYDLARVISAERSEIEYARNARLIENVDIRERGNDSPHHYPTGEPTIRSHFLHDAS